jgi:hypothetical protein
MREPDNQEPSKVQGTIGLSSAVLSTFRKERWRFARERTGPLLEPALKDFTSNWTAATLSFLLGGLVFGAAFIVGEAELM